MQYLNTASKTGPCELNTKQSSVVWHSLYCQMMETNIASNDSAMMEGNNLKVLEPVR